VRSFAQDVSPYGVFDMAGNVSEWTADWYFEDYGVSGTLNPVGPANQPYSESLRVARGGSFQAIYPFARTGQRFDMNVESTNAWLGFRCVMDVEGASPPAEDVDAGEAPAEDTTPPDEGALPGEEEVPADTEADTGTEP
jgi:hypothetical protein